MDLWQQNYDKQCNILNIFFLNISDNAENKLDKIQYILTPKKLSKANEKLR